MKGRLLVATLVLALALVVDIGVSRRQSPAGPDPDPVIPELRAGPVIPAVSNAAGKATNEAPALESDSPAAESSSPTTSPVVGDSGEPEPLQDTSVERSKEDVVVELESAARSSVPPPVLVEPAAGPSPAPRSAPAAAIPPPVQRVAASQPPAQPPVAAASVSLYAFERDMYNSHNSYRAQAGLAGLQLDPTLVLVARQRAADMAQNGYFSHYSPTNPGQAQVYAFLSAAGYSYHKAGENIARNNYPDNQSVNVAMNAFMASAGHYANIMNSNYRSVGIGYANGANGMKYYAVVFAY